MILDRNKRLLQNHDSLATWWQRIANTIIVVSTLFGLAYWYDGFIGLHYRYMAIIAVLTMLLIYHYFGVHRRFEGRFGGVFHLARAWGFVIILLGWVAFFTKTTEEYSRTIIFCWAILAYVFQALFYSFSYYINSLFRRNDDDGVPALIVGTGMLARHLARSINANMWLPDKIVGIVARDEDDAKAWHSTDADVVGTIDDLENIVISRRIRRVYIALRLSHSEEVAPLKGRLEQLNIDIIWVPDVSSFQLLNPSVRELAGVPLLALSETPLMAGGPAFVKLSMDKIISTLALLLLSPLLLIVAIGVKLSSAGPIIFKQKRHGWDGKVIEVWKFRSMYMHKEQGGIVSQAQRNDKRITPIGHFIRRTSIDELPQLFNVLQGRMSLVGPRPHAVEHNVYYSDKVKAYLTRHRIKPGITGLAQIKGYRGETDTLEKMEARLQYDLEYINAWSPLLDLKILFLTPIALLSSNAY